MNIYGAAYKRDELEPLLIWATPGQRGFKKEMHGNIPGQFNTTPLQYVATTQLAATPLTQSNDTNQVREILSTLEKISDEDRRSSLLENLCSNVDFLNLPLHPQPPGTKRGNLTIDLLRHQVRQRYHLAFTLLTRTESSVTMGHRARVSSSTCEGVRSTCSILEIVQERKCRYATLLPAPDQRSYKLFRRLITTIVRRKNVFESHNIT